MIWSIALWFGSWSIRCVEIKIICVVLEKLFMWRVKCSRYVRSYHSSGPKWHLISYWYDHYRGLKRLVYITIKVRRLTTVSMGTLLLHGIILTWCHSCVVLVPWYQLHCSSLVWWFALSMPLLCGIIIIQCHIYCLIHIVTPTFHITHMHTILFILARFLHRTETRTEKKGMERNKKWIRRDYESGE